MRGRRVAFHARQHAGETQVGGVFAEAQVGQRVEFDAEPFHYVVDVGLGIEQRDRDDVQVGNDRQLGQDGADEFGKAGRADDFKVERLVPAHDGVVALSLLEQIGHARAQIVVFGRQLAVRYVWVVHRISFRHIARTLREVCTVGNEN